MNSSAKNRVYGMVRNALYGALPGMWFAYIGGHVLWMGGLAGTSFVLFLAVFARVLQKRSARARPSGAAGAKPGSGSGLF